MAGGIKKTGSLRNIRIINGDKVEEFDFYNFFQPKNTFISPSLSEGSMIIIPPVGNTFATAGSIKKPGIYELKNNSFTIQDALNVSGGLVGSGKLNITLETINPNGDLKVIGKVSENYTLKNGDIIRSNAVNLRKQGYFKVLGSVLNEITVPLDQYPSLESLFETNNPFLPNSFKDQL